MFSFNIVVPPLLFGSVKASYTLLIAFWKYNPLVFKYAYQGNGTEIPLPSRPPGSGLLILPVSIPFSPPSFYRNKKSSVPHVMVTED